MIGVCVRTREQEREGQRKARFSLHLLLCHFWEERAGPNASSGPFLQILHLMEETDLHSARFEGKYLLELKRNGKQARNETKAAVGLKLFANKVSISASSGKGIPPHRASTLIEMSGDGTFGEFSPSFPIFPLPDNLNT